MLVETPGASEPGRLPGANFPASPLTKEKEERIKVFDAPVFARAIVCVEAAPGAIAPNARLAGADRLGSSAGPAVP